MALRDQIDTDMKAAMKAGDKPRLDAIRLIKSEYRKKEIDDRITLEDDALAALLSKMVKQRQDSIDQYKAGGRQDLVDKETFELNVIQSYMPAQMGEEEIRALVAQAVKETGAATGKDMGG